MLRTWVGSQAPPTPHLRTSVRWVGLVPGNAKKPLTVPGLQPPFPPQDWNPGLCLPFTWGFYFSVFGREKQLLLPCEIRYVVTM